MKPPICISVVTVAPCITLSELAQYDIFKVPFLILSFHLCQVCQVSFPPTALCTYSRPHSRIFCVPFISLFVRPHNILFIHNPQKFLIMTLFISSSSFPTLTSQYSTQLRGAYWCTLLTEYCSFAEIETNEMGGGCSTTRERRGVYRVLVRKPEGKRPLGRARRRWEDNSKRDLREAGLGGHGLEWSGSR